MELTVRDASCGYEGKAILSNVSLCLRQGEIVCILGPNGIGKTTIFRSVLGFLKLISGEILLDGIPKEQLSQRILSMESRVESTRMKKGEVDPDDWEKISVAMDKLQNAKILIEDTPGIGIAEIRNKCRRMKAEKGLDMVIIDYLQLMSLPGRHENRQNEIAALSRQLKLLARELDCPILVLSQLSRLVEGRTDKHPMMSDLRESGAIEQDADIILMLYRDEVYNPQTAKPNICEVEIAKHRGGETGRIELYWLAQYTRFADKASDSFSHGMPQTSAPDNSQQG